MGEPVTNVVHGMNHIRFLKSTEEEPDVLFPK